MDMLLDEYFEMELNLHLINYVLTCALGDVLKNNSIKTSRKPQ